MIKNKKLRQTIKTIIYIIFSIFLCVILFIHKKFGDITFEQFLYNITNTQGANYSVVFEGIIFVILRLVIASIIILGIFKLYKILKLKINILNNKLFKYSCLISYILFTFLIAILLLNINDFILYQTTSTKLFEDNYVDARNVELTFPKKKRNLIYIYLESMEMSNASIKNGGLFEKSYMPRLEELALKNINFSNTNKLGGAYQTDNASWTMAALIAHTSGIPLKLSLNKNVSDSKSFVPGAYTLGDILYENGYNNYFMIGSDADFGGRKDYFQNHGNYKIYDYYYAQNENLIDSDYFVWWGYEDLKLFEFAKDKILEASKKDKPFNFTLLTVDTHFTDGYIDDSCEKLFDSDYANAIYCSDQKVYSFVNWLKDQDFYKNTTIILTGDHLTMQNNFYNKELNDKRTIYNVFINSPIEPIKEKNRVFTTLDMFPTTLAALGIKIEGNKLGLGVNLFSKEKTLSEELGLDKFNTETSKKSYFYNKVLLNNSYYKSK